MLKRFLTLLSVFVFFCPAYAIEQEFSLVEDSVYLLKDGIVYTVASPQKVLYLYADFHNSSRQNQAKILFGSKQPVLYSYPIVDLNSRYRNFSEGSEILKIQKQLAENISNGVNYQECPINICYVDEKTKEMFVMNKPEFMSVKPEELLTVDEIARTMYKNMKFLKSVNDKIILNWNPSKNPLHDNFAVIAEIAFDNSGNLVDYRLKTPSVSEKQNEAVKEAIRKSFPVQVPTELKKEKYFYLPVKFVKMNMYSNILSDGSPFVHQSSIASLEKKIASNLSGEISYTLTMEIEIDNEGNIQNERIIKSSNKEEDNLIAKAAIDKTFPYKLQIYNQSNKNVKLMIVFSKNIRVTQIQ